MRTIEITANDAGRRLDRFLRKYLPKASLGSIYKIIRKDVKVDGKRKGEEYVLSEGETISLYLSDEMINELRGGTVAEHSDGKKARRNFKIIYEDDNILVVDKPYGLLTHGDSTEKKNHLANQIKDYLIEQGEYKPRIEKVFAPAPANRLDRNTTGLVLCGKTSQSLKGLNEMIRQDFVRKFYVTIVHGKLDREMKLGGYLVKDHKTNKVKIVRGNPDNYEEAKEVVTIVRPISTFRDGKQDYTYIEVELVTGRTHQIRAHLASIGHPLIGDVKYGGKKVFGLSTQLLHAARIEFSGSAEGLEYLEDIVLAAPLPEEFKEILEGKN